jgi:hypothetical protein
MEKEIVYKKMVAIESFLSLLEANGIYIKNPKGENKPIRGVFGKEKMLIYETHNQHVERSKKWKEMEIKVLPTRNKTFNHQTNLIMNTPLNTLISQIKNKLDKFPENLLLSERGLYDGYLNAMNMAIELLESEKQMTIDAHEAGLGEGFLHQAGKIPDKISTDYYNTKYNNK